jgi:hypothetical protein
VYDTATGTATVAKKKKISKRTSGYTPKEGICLCRSWLLLAKTPFLASSKRAKPIGGGVIIDYHERWQLKPFKIHSNHGQVSIQKRWSLIQQETNKFCGAIETVQRRPKSGTGVIDMLCPWPYVICPYAMPIRNVCCTCVSGHHFIMFVGSSCLGILQDRP